ncbi:MAG: 16S rRNA (cytosine(1402)-N(4))-methyltransferase RsmH [Pseudomonadales bacterium]
MSGSHAPVLCRELVSLVTGMAPPAGTAGGASVAGIREGVYVDATFGRGGHSRALLDVLGPDSRVIAFDRDPEAVAEGRALALAEPRFDIRQGNFSQLGDLLEQMDVGLVQGVIMDLGVSSPQLDDPQRGFSFRFDAPLDMRMNPDQGPSAADWLNAAAETEISRVLREYGEERYARRIAAAIVAARPLRTTAQLAAVVSQAQPRRTPGKHDATRVFQAIRMQINDELGELRAGLAQAFAVLRAGGRLAVISFHSLEDRLVKRFFRELSQPPQLPRRLPVRDAAARPAALSIAGPIRAGADELAANPRARSAVLRVLEKAA